MVLRPDAAELRGIRRHAVRDRATSLVAGAAVLAGLVSVPDRRPAILAGGVAGRRRSPRRPGCAATCAAAASCSQAAEKAPSVVRVASAVADGLLGAGLTRRGSDSVEVVVDHEGEYRCLLRDVDEVEAGLFVEALEEAVSPIGLPRYLVPRWVRTKRRARASAAGPSAGRRCWPASAGSGSDGVVWHAVPTVLGVNAERAAAYAKAWDHWVGGGDPVYTGSPEGQGILAANQGTDPFDASTVMRRQWA